MAHSSSPTPPTGTTSYTAMEMPEKDLESIGAHCEYSYCHQLDFLPFRCESCHHTFCLDHRTETAHKCARAGEWARNRRRNSVGTSTNDGVAAGRTTKPNVMTGQQCSHPKCKTLVHTFQHTGVHCHTCNRDYCLKHRFKEEHDCKNLTPLGARPSGTGTTASSISSASASIQAKLAFSRLRSWSKEKKSSISTSFPTPTSKASAARSSALAELTALKRDAKGDPSLATDRRLYLHVEAEAEAGPTTSTPTPSSHPPPAAAAAAKTPPRMALYFDQSWTVGRLLDDAAKKLQVRNENNSTQGEEGRLRVFFVEGGRVLEFKERIGEALRSGNTIVLLRGVGDGKG